MLAQLSFVSPVALSQENFPLLLLKETYRGGSRVHITHMSAESAHLVRYMLLAELGPYRARPTFKVVFLGFF